MNANHFVIRKGLNSGRSRSRDLLFLPCSTFPIARDARSDGQTVIDSLLVAEESPIITRGMRNVFKDNGMSFETPEQQNQARQN